MKDRCAYVVATGDHICPAYLAVIDGKFTSTFDDSAALRLAMWEDALAVISTLPNSDDFRAEEYCWQT